MTFRKKIVASLLVGSGVLAVSSPVLANDSEELEKLRALVQELDQKIRVLDRKNELAAEEAAAKKKETPVVKASEKGFGLQSADGQHEIRLRGLLQADGRGFATGRNQTQKAAAGASTAGYLDNTEDANSTALLRRVRPTIEGTVFGKYDFRFTPEYGDGKSQVIDAYLDARFAPWFKLRAGKYKPFVGLERLQSGADIKFIERSYVSSILPNRDVGASIYGDVLDGRLSYAVGIHNGVADGGDNTTASDFNKDKDYAARLFTVPFKDSDSALAGLGFGIAATYGNVDGTTKDTVNGSSTELTSGYKTEGQQTFFRYVDGSVLRSGIGEGATLTGGPGVSWLAHADGKRTRIAPQAYYYYGPFGLLAEYTRVSQEVAVGQSSHAKTTLNHDAWEIAASYLLTGEDASFKGVKPKRNFDLDNGGWGAWEIVGRYSELNLDDDSFAFGNLSGGAGVTANQSTGAVGAGTLQTLNHYLYADPKASAKSAHTWTAGINWYVNPEVKISLNYAQTAFDGGGALTSSPTHTFKDLVVRSNARDREDERVLLARFQIAF
ncbi:MAG TPA: porin [Novimethylophilus sp.]|jgi:phosphate-selective porin OprO/OprP|uniref:OprO/OprP family phosphate-selective porin n=1 Tax=Novimethylophilus sp. TaxID=2137426 RepID=UPI002F40E5FB